MGERPKVKVGWEGGEGKIASGECEEEAMGLELAEEVKVGCFGRKEDEPEAMVEGLVREEAVDGTRGEETSEVEPEALGCCVGDDTGGEEGMMALEVRRGRWLLLSEKDVVEACDGRGAGGAGAGATSMLLLDDVDATTGAATAVGGSNLTALGVALPPARSDELVLLNAGGGGAAGVGCPPILSPLPL